MLDNEPSADARDIPAEPHTTPFETEELIGHRSYSDESIVDELSALIDDGKTYAEAEIAFQKTRAKLAGKNVGKAIAFAVLAIILLHIALLALAVGLVIALQPLVTIWGAIAIVVGVLLIATAILAGAAMSRGKLVGQLFGSEKDTP